jgi:hypothetical protein
MKTYDNHGRLVGEINTILHDGSNQMEERQRCLQNQRPDSVPHLPLVVPRCRALSEPQV